MMSKLAQQQESLSAALQEANQANKTKTAFLSNMSHEIRTPMNAIIGLNNIALNDPTISAQTREHLERIGISAHHLLGIINDILDMSRIESGRMMIKSEEFSFAKMLEQINTIVSGQCSDKGLKYDCRTVGRIIRATNRADAATIPIIALTANAFDEDAQRSMQAGLNAHLSKPVEPDLLFETLEELLAE